MVEIIVLLIVFCATVGLVVWMHRKFPILRSDVVDRVQQEIEIETIGVMEKKNPTIEK